MKNSVVAGMVALFALSAVGAVAGELELPAGTVKVSQGEVVILRNQQTIPATVGSLVMGGDRVTTGRDGKAGITLRDNTVLSAGPCSTLTITRFAFNPTTLDGAIDATLSRGTMAVISGKLGKTAPEAVKFQTPITMVGVRGTEFLMSAGAGCD